MGHIIESINFFLRDSYDLLMMQSIKWTNQKDNKNLWIL